MTVDEDFLVLKNNNEEGNFDWVHDSVYKRKLGQLLKELEKKDYMVMHLFNGDLDAFYTKTFKIRYSWCNKNFRFVRTRSNSRNTKNKDITEEEL